MDDFLLRFAKCTTPGDASTCSFSVVREGLIVSLLSIGTLFGALFGAPYVCLFCDVPSSLQIWRQDGRFPRAKTCHGRRMRRVHCWCHHPVMLFPRLATICRRTVGKRARCRCSERCCSHGEYPKNPSDVSMLISLVSVPSGDCPCADPRNPYVNTSLPLDMTAH
jgi:hypothetical protein